MITLTENQISADVTENPLHIPVMISEVIEGLRLKPQDCVVDGTIGLAGHSESMAKIIGAQGRLIGIDKDQDSLDLARERLEKLSVEFELINDDYRHIDRVLDGLGIKEVNGILLDLGISSYQLNSPERGFSFNMDGPLDMRMDKKGYISAFDLINSLSEKEISTILKNFGQERWHHRIARSLVERRTKKPISSTKDLSDTVLRAIPGRYRKQRIHPATRTFQAIRIAVNRELEALDLALEHCMNYLAVGGRICVISFHSLEDRIVKEKFRQFHKQGKISLIVKKPLRPTEQETAINPRSRSARLRIAERIK